ncbi:MAG: bifunctional phosphoribosylaminoimidazolecarboxamide formyltransferase/IMP cyclohydrolase [Planctomycetes bacterium]|nr:bifunctional phosphoribosylaminoimidazolecarboxamide formyltransferase/IMP cyclohydrolase [Planctomycetota bacterium]
MSSPVPIRRALLSVSDKRGLAEFARMLAAAGVEIVSTGGTAKALAEAGIPVVPIEQLTGFPEMLDGRVKTLHPKVHGGLLGRRDIPEHVEQMRKHGIEPIDLVCVSLYPFAATIAKPGVTEEEAIEQIDIGGPAMIRSASKNHEFVAVVTSPDQYGRVAEEMQANHGATTMALRRALAAEAFEHTARYDAMIAGWMGRAPESFPDALPLLLTRKATLRYGENPHQQAALYRNSAEADGGIVEAETVEGKPLSYNNILDASAAFDLVRDLAAISQEGVAACVVKHTNPCGAAIAADAFEAFDRAYAGDPLAAYGGIVAISSRVTASAAQNIAKSERFLEVVVAESFEPEAVALLATRWKNVRLLAVGSMRLARASVPQLRSVPGGVLVQEPDSAICDAKTFKHVAGPAPSAAMLRDVEFLTVISKHLKSNAVCIGSQQSLWGAGAGQMDRVASCRHAIAKAGSRLSAAGSTMVTAASDAFFPFDDGPRLLIDAGVKCLVHPGGSKRDADTEALCRERNVTLLVTGTRHFRH